MAKAARVGWFNCTTRVIVNGEEGRRCFFQTILLFSNMKRQGAKMTSGSHDDANVEKPLWTNKLIEKFDS